MALPELVWSGWEPERLPADPSRKLGSEVRFRSSVCCGAKVLGSYPKPKNGKHELQGRCVACNRLVVRYRPVGNQIRYLKRADLKAN